MKRLAQSPDIVGEEEDVEEEEKKELRPPCFDDEGFVKMGMDAAVAGAGLITGGGTGLIVATIGAGAGFGVGVGTGAGFEAAAIFACDATSALISSGETNWATGAEVGVRSISGGGGVWGALSGAKAGSGTGHEARVEAGTSKSCTGCACGYVLAWAGVLFVAVSFCVEAAGEAPFAEGIFRTCPGFTVFLVMPLAFLSDFTVQPNFLAISEKESPETTV